ncbi:DUF6629 family protein [Ruegeria profundi]|uniref:DUF6629 family protein n=1 Tax=Ruegeria profundi TaxID=1685378 RepID=UPI00299F0268|nr:DUF6629 family protein [Ruegeria profundi]
MCFSASASFATAAVLMPVAAITLTTASRYNRKYLGFAVFPLFFGIQQALEGGLWLSLGQGGPETTHWFAIGFLFFAYFFWPFWVPLSAYFVEPKRHLKRIFLIFSLLGALLGAFLFAPLLFLDEPLPIHIVQHSIHYSSPLMWDSIMLRTLIRGVYAIIVCAPILLSSISAVRMFGFLTTLSVIGGFVVAHYAFTSIWCFAAAILSCYVLFIIREASKSVPTHRPNEI